MWSFIKALSEEGIVLQNDCKARPDYPKTNFITVGYLQMPVRVERDREGGVSE